MSLNTNASAFEILSTDFVKTYMRDLFAVDTFGIVSFCTYQASFASLLNLLRIGRRRDIIYGVNFSGEMFSSGMVSERETITDDGRKVKYFAYDTGKRAPVWVILPGGAYATCCIVAEGIPIAAKLAEHGINSIIVKYSTGKNACGLQPLQDVYAAMRDAQKLEHFDFSHCTVCGFSAGGHLAGLASEKENCEKAGITMPELAVLCYPVISFGEHAHTMSRKLFLGNRQSDSGQRKLFSLENRAEFERSPVFMYHCKDDDIVPVENSRLFADALKKAGKSCYYREYERGGHGLGLGIGTPEEGWLSDAIHAASDLAYQYKLSG